MKHDLVSILGDSAVIEQVANELKVDGVEVDKPQPANALSEALNDPFSLAAAAAILKFMTVSFATGTSAVVFFSKLIDLLRKLEGNHQLKLIDLEKGQPLLTIGANSVAKDIVDKLMG